MKTFSIKSFAKTAIILFSSYLLILVSIIILYR